MTIKSNPFTKSNNTGGVNLGMLYDQRSYLWNIRIEELLKDLIIKVDQLDDDLDKSNRQDQDLKNQVYENRRFKQFIKSNIRSIVMEIALIKSRDEYFYKMIEFLYKQSNEKINRGIYSTQNKINFLLLVVAVIALIVSIYLAIQEWIPYLFT